MERMEGWLRTAIAAFFRLMHIPLSESALQSLVQFVKFGLVGVTNTAVSYVINILVLKLLQPYHLSWDYVAGNVVAFVLSVLWSFYWNNKYVFRKGEGQTRNLGRALLKTYVAYGLTGIVLANALSYVWINVFGVSKYVAPLINLVISIPLNFIINKFWAFRTEPES
jgi:putative flippase GtrA